MAYTSSPDNAECDPIAIVSTDAIVSNYRIAQKLHGGRAMAVVKSDAYGHGLQGVVRALEPVVDALAVQTVKEAVVLRDLSITLPILVLGGAVSCDDFRAAAHHRLWVAASEYERTAQMLESVQNGTIGLWLGLTSNLNRGGLSATEAMLLTRKIQRSPNLRLHGVMSHTGCPHAPLGESTTDSQDEAAYVRAIQAVVGGDRSVHTSDAILGGANDPDGWARIGALMYGLINQGLCAKHGVLATMTLESSVREVCRIRRGQTVGYGSTFRAAHDMLIGLVPVGYAHGYPRTTGRGPDVRVGGCVVSIVGAVSMNGLAIDLTDVPWVEPGDTVTLWGASPSICGVALAAGVIPEVLTTAVGNAARSGVVTRRIGGAVSPDRLAETLVSGIRFDRTHSLTTHLATNSPRLRGQ